MRFATRSAGARLRRPSRRNARSVRGHAPRRARAGVPPLGAATWHTPTFDAELRLVYFATGQPTPRSAALRGAGDALYSNSILALEADTGKIRWHYQILPGESWDLDSPYESMLIDMVIDGQKRKALIHTSKIGWGVILDRTTGKFL